MPAWAGRRVTVVGAGRSGTAAADLLNLLGAIVVVTDQRRPGQLGDFSRLESAGIRFELGGHPESLWQETELVVGSPGIAPSAPPLAAARAQNVPVISEIELAAQCTNVPALAITGSNGKSTVTAMTGAILNASGRNTEVCGNIGVSWAGLVADAIRGVADPDLYVLELSSFQTETIRDFHPRWCALLNLSADHLDRHGDFNSYAEAKLRIAANCNAEDWLIYGADDQFIRENLPAAPRAVPFAHADPSESPSAFVRDQNIIWRDASGDEHRVLAVADLPVLGSHNALNACAATALACLAGATPGAARQALAEFRGLPHRSELCATLDGVLCINDSKATNVGATVAALRGLDAPIWLILGGRDKDSDFRQLLPHLGNVRGVLLVGEATDAIAEALGDAVPVQRCETLETAVAAGLAGSQPADALLLAPACTSFDQYSSFEARGEHFRTLINDRL
ncbi:MAG: UDP-N-acetylmuramoyl-L-alanine--D-glutamate ligase [Acidobacteria bacterium]|nr:UDP-N-acetylmuramoyl-L-alanine--D-glutamate ligase [Acidobacteriota bacterium]